MTIQGTDEWRTQRLGKLTASRAHDAIAKIKSGGWAASRANLRADLIVERLTGQAPDSFKSAAMQYGTDNEDLARRAYIFRTDADVEQVGFIDHPNIPMSGASPDGLVGKDGLLEIKVPNSATHIDCLLGKGIPANYRTQMNFQMSVTGRAWVDYVSFDPRIPERLRYFCERIHRDEKVIHDLEREVEDFLAEVDDVMQRLRHGD